MTQHDAKKTTMFDANRINTLGMLWDFAHLADSYLPKDPKVVAIGQGKEMAYANLLTGMVPKSEIIYYYEGSKIKGMKAKSRAKELGLLEKITFTTKKPEEKFDLGVYLFSLHHFYNKNGPKTQETLQKAYDLLNPGGRILVIDYELDWIRKEIEQKFSPETAKIILIQVFNTLQESGVCIKPEKKKRTEPEFPSVTDLEEERRKEEEARKPKPQSEYEPDFYESHTWYNLEKCVADLEAVGFDILDKELAKFEGVFEDSEWGERPKLFLTVGEK